MARNATSGEGYRIGSVKDRVQVYNPKTEKWTKIDTNTNRFIDQKADGKPFKGVTKK